MVGQWQHRPCLNPSLAPLHYRTQGAAICKYRITNGMRSGRTTPQDSAFSSPTDTSINIPGMTLPRRAWVRLNRLRTGVGRFRSAEIIMHYYSTRWCGYIWSDVFLSVMPLHDEKMASYIFMGFWMQPWSILVFCLKSTNRKTPWNGGSFRRILPQFDQANDPTRDIIKTDNRLVKWPNCSSLFLDRIVIKNLHDALPTQPPTTTKETVSVRRSNQDASGNGVPVRL